LQELYPRVPHALGAPVLQIEQLAGRRLPVSASLTLRAGEILGIFGLVGAGRTELLRVLFGLDPVAGGRVYVQGRTRKHWDPAQRIADGTGLLSEDRKREGLALMRSIADNVTYSRLSPYLRGWWLRLAKRRRAVAAWIQRLQLRCRGPEQRVVELSGGNQQKVALARLLHQQARVLLLDEPTRGVDVGSKAEIYRLIGELASEGKSILLVSSYLPELLGVCDTLAVMARGRLSPARPVTDWTSEQIMEAATGGGNW
jgi:ribose transport system ATP-binding protein